MVKNPPPDAGGHMKRHSIRDWGNSSQNHNEHYVAPNKTGLEFKKIIITNRK